jgi:diaminopimelate decarboxylase
MGPKTHPYITTGLKKNKFGILWERRKAIPGIQREPYVTPVGISSHIGSQITEMVRSQRSALKGMIAELRRTDRTQVYGH